MAEMAVTAAATVLAVLAVDHSSMPRMQVQCIALRSQQRMQQVLGSLGAQKRPGTCTQCKLETEAMRVQPTESQHTC